MFSFKKRWLLSLSIVCLGICSVVIWKYSQSDLPPEGALDFRFSHMSYNRANNGEIKDIPLTTNNREIKSIPFTANNREIKNIPSTTNNIPFTANNSEVKEVSFTTNHRKVKDISLRKNNRELKKNDVPSTANNREVKVIPFTANNRKIKDIPIIASNREVRDTTFICSANSSYESQLQILQKRLQLLREHIPANYSANVRNPCWYDLHQIPSLQESRQLHLSQREENEVEPGKCDTLLSYNPSLAKLVANQAKAVGQMHLHCLPSFFLSGFSRCASTSLYEIIVQHPQVVEPICKESHFWGQFVNQKGTDLDKKMQILQYLDYFSPSIPLIESNPQKITLDASVSYHNSDTDFDFCVLPNLLMRVLPEPKFIVIMRNPSKRVLSHYFYHVRRRFATLPEYHKYLKSAKALKLFHNQTSAVVERFQSCVESGYPTHSCVRNSTIDEKNHVGLQKSMYYYHLVPWLNTIPRERFLFLRTEDLARNRSLTLSKVWNFLHLDNLPQTKHIFAKFNRHPVLPTHTRELLHEFFQPHNELLANLLSDSRYLWKDSTSQSSVHRKSTS